MSESKLGRRPKGETYERPTLTKLGHMSDGIVAKSVGAHDTMKTSKPTGA